MNLIVPLVVSRTLHGGLDNVISVCLEIEQNPSIQRLLLLSLSRDDPVQGDELKVLLLRGLTHRDQRLSRSRLNYPGNLVGGMGSITFGMEGSDPPSSTDSAECQLLLAAY